MVSEAFEVYQNQSKDPVLLQIFVVLSAGRHSRKNLNKYSKFDKLPSYREHNHKVKSFRHFQSVRHKMFFWDFATHSVTNSRYDVENNGRVDGKIPVKDFEKILEENVLWVEKVPADVRANIIALTDMDGDGYVSQEEFLQLANGRNIPGFNRRRRRALRELLKQTVEFIVSHTDCFSTNACIMSFQQAVKF